MPRPGSFTPVKTHPVIIVYETGWAPEPVWTAAENLAPTGIRFPDRPAPSESLYKQSFPGPHFRHVNKNKKIIIIIIIIIIIKSVSKPKNRKQNQNKIIHYTSFSNFCYTAVKTGPLKREMQKG
jgi:hypothetical protein